MALTLLVKSTVVDADATDAAITTVLQSVTTTHVYSVSIMPLSNSKMRIIMVYD